MDFFSPFDKPFGSFSSHMSGMGSHPLGSPMSSYYSAGMTGMSGLSPNFGMPVSMYSGQSAMTMGMSSSMAGLGSSMSPGQTGASLPNVSTYPSSSSPYPGSSSPLSTAMQHSVLNWVRWRLGGWLGVYNIQSRVLIIKYTVGPFLSLLTSLSSVQFVLDMKNEVHPANDGQSYLVGGFIIFSLYRILLICIECSLTTIESAWLFFHKSFIT